MSVWEASDLDHATHRTIVLYRRAIADVLGIQAGSGGEGLSPWLVPDRHPKIVLRALESMMTCLGLPPEVSAPPATEGETQG